MAEPTGQGLPGLHHIYGCIFSYLSIVQKRKSGRKKRLHKSPPRPSVGGRGKLGKS